MAVYTVSNPYLVYSSLFWVLVPHLLMFEARQYMSTLLIIILVLFLLGGGGWGYSRWRG